MSIILYITEVHVQYLDRTEEKTIDEGQYDEYI